MRSLIALCLFALANAKPSGYKYWGDHGPSGIVDGAGASGPAGHVDGLGTKGLVGIVTGHGAIGPNGEHSSDGWVEDNGKIGLWIINDGVRGWNNENNVLVASGIKNNHWGDHGPSGFTDGHGASGPSGEVDGLGAKGPAGIVTGNGAIGPNGEHNEDGKQEELLIVNSDETCDDVNGNSEILININNNEDNWVDDSGWDGHLVILEDGDEDCEDDKVALVELASVHI